MRRQGSTGASGRPCAGSGFLALSIPGTGDPCRILRSLSLLPDWVKDAYLYEFAEPSLKLHPVFRMWELHEPWIAALDGIDEFQLIEALYWLHEFRRDLVPMD